MLILTDYIFHHEFKPLQKHFRLEDIREGAGKVLRNLAISIRPPQKIHSFKFFKVRIGRKTKGRMIVFMMIENNKIVPILIRLKKDKIFGKNMAMNNPEVIDQINRNLDHILIDIKNRHYQEF